MTDPEPLPDRLTALEELVRTLRPVVTSINSDKAMGTAGLVGQYRAALAEIEQIRASAPDVEGTALDEVNARRAAKVASGPSGTPRRRV